MCDTKKYLITITNTICPTSMAYYEFVLYRREFFPDEKHILLIPFDTENPSPDFNDPDVYYCGLDLKKIRKTAKETAERCEKEGASYAFHIHEGKSVILFNIATRFKYRKKIVYTVHSTYTKYKFHNKLFARIASRISKYLVCVSKTSFKYFPARIKKRMKNRAVCIPNGVDVNRVDRICAQNPPQRAAGERLRLVYTARFMPSKNHELLIELIKANKKAELLLLGDGPCFEAIKESAKTNSVGDRVFFAGMVERDDVYKMIAESDVYVSPSLFEGLPISVLEAMACGKICLLSDIEQHAEIAESCKSLITVKNDLDSWKQALDKIMSMSTEEREKIGAENKKSVAKNYSLKTMHEQYTKIYELLWNK